MRTIYKGECKLLDALKRINTPIQIFDMNTQMYVEPHHKHYIHGITYYNDKTVLDVQDTPSKFIYIESREV